jgi:hypothetical protein
MVSTKVCEEGDLWKDPIPIRFPVYLQVYETLVGRKIAKMKKAVRMKNNTW